MRRGGKGALARAAARTALFGGILAAGAALWSTGCSGRMDPRELIDRYVSLHRSGDVAGLLALHTPDAEFLIPGQEPVRGTEALRHLFEWDAVLESGLVMTGVRAEGDTIHIDSVIERNRWFAALGLPEVRYRPGTRFVLRDGRIAGVYPADLDDDTLSRLAAAFGRVTAWLSANRPEALEQLLPGGRFRYDAARARLWLDVLDAWKQSGSAPGR